VLGRATIDAQGTASPAGECGSARVASPACGGGTGRGLAASQNPDGNPLPTPPPQAGEGAGPSSGESVTQSKRAETQKQITWLALEPLTGRTHQLRVHGAESGFPVLGDNIYGSAPRFGGPGLHLHAREIVVPLYKNRPPIRVSAPVPPHMIERLKWCGWIEEPAMAHESVAMRRGYP
jgi:tRNA pseudouridine32 synthase / 23S rRNA pseudouridine746 synthase